MVKNMLQADRVIFVYGLHYNLLLQITTSEKKNSGKICFRGSDQQTNYQSIN